MGEDNAMFNIFVYGSLRDSLVFQSVCGFRFTRKPSRQDATTLFAEPAFLPGHKKVSPDNVYFYAVGSPNARIEGLVIYNVPAATLTEIDRYEGRYYERETVHVNTAVGLVQAQAYLASQEEGKSVSPASNLVLLVHLSCPPASELRCFRSYVDAIVMIDVCYARYLAPGRHLVRRRRSDSRSLSSPSGTSFAGRWAADTPKPPTTNRSVGGDYRLRADDLAAGGLVAFRAGAGGHGHDDDDGNDEDAEVNPRRQPSLLSQEVLDPKSDKSSQEEAQDVPPGANHVC